MSYNNKKRKIDVDFTLIDTIDIDDITEHKEKGLKYIKNLDTLRENTRIKQKLLILKDKLETNNTKFDRLIKQCNSSEKIIDINDTIQDLQNITNSNNSLNEHINIFISEEDPKSTYNYLKTVKKWFQWDQ